MTLICALALVLLCAQGATLELRLLEDHSGDPIPAAVIRIAKTGTSNLIAEVESDALGRVRVENLAQGEYRADISKPNSATLRVLSDTPAVVRLIRTAAISGQVVDDRGRGVRGAAVFAMRKSTTRFRAGMRTGTDSQGRYRVYGLEPGEYAVAVTYGNSSAALQSSGSAATPPALGSGATFYPDNVKPQIFDVRGGEEFANRNFRIAAGTLNSVTGTVSATEPFWLSLVPVERPSLAAVATSTDATGAFRFSAVTPGSYLLLGSGPVQALGPRMGTVGPAKHFIRIPVDVSGADVAIGNIVPVDGRTLNVTLRKEDCSSAARLTLSSAEDWGASLNRTVNLSSSKSEQVTALAPGEHHLTLSTATEECFAIAAPLVDVTYQAALVVRLVSAGGIRGRVALAGANARDWTVVLLSDTLSQIAQIDAQGSFAFPSLRPGPYRIAVRPAEQARWFGDSIQGIDVPSGKSLTLELTLPRGAR